MEDLQMYDEFNVSSKIAGSYSVAFINDLDQQLMLLAKGERVIFIIDQKVLHLFNENFESIMSSARLVLIDSSETSKTLDYSQEIIRKLLKINIRKGDRLIAIGGGITQDIVAFISSILFRGLEWIFLPTTLLAQCDSCIGSKSSINFDSYKNLLGTFNPPSQIFIYHGFLNTLTEVEIRSGIGEMLHYFFTDGIKLAQQLTDQIDQIILDRTKLRFFIRESLQIKKRIIEIDEFDLSIRHIFNYGHTFGHALEAITNYEISHGQAVTFGMDLANYISLKSAMINERQFAEMHNVLLKNIPTYEFNLANIEDYLSALMKDKKNKGNKIGCILTRGPGKIEKIFLDNDGWLKRTILDYSSKFNYA